MEPKQQLALLKRNIDTLISEEELLSKLSENRPLRVKLGVDPTRPDLTFGHLVVFNKLRQFQDLGHQAILIIGDFTTTIGDPSGRSSTRPVLTEAEIRQNAETYLEQAFRVLDKEKTRVVYNSEWFSRMSFSDCLGLARKMTVARMLERDDFSKRHRENVPISIIEFLYPLVQGYDSLILDADVELGGTDQLFNNLVGRALQKDAGKSQQIVMTLPLLVGLDGVKKMSKSQDNYIAFNDSPKDMFGKIMSISDTTMWDYYRLLLLYSPEEVKAMESDHPMECKKALAAKLVGRFHGQEVADAARSEFELVFSKNRIPDEMPEFSWSAVASGNEETLVNVMAATALFSSKKEIGRFIQQGAVKMDGNPVTDAMVRLSRPAQPLVVQVGKRVFFRIR
ncbi:MAG: Tyrosine--tRNA ligase [Verrucomicrobia bacterium ADurb.Bin474]|nr:MAG: Tyrosine--tRNA ligase [Verrucomicrobia bacterium ADurb.Bin474]